jgi:hypothetical protein
MDKRVVKQYFSMPDELRGQIRPLLPVEPPKPKAEVFGN